MSTKAMEAAGDILRVVVTKLRNRQDPIEDICGSLEEYAREVAVEAYIVGIQKHTNYVDDFTEDAEEWWEGRK